MNDKKLQQYEGMATQKLRIDRARWLASKPAETTVFDPFEGQDIDAPEVMVELLRELFDRGVEFVDYTQETNGSPCHVAFEGLAEALAFFEAVTPNEAQHEEGGHEVGVFNDSQMGDDRPERIPWTYEMFPCRNGDAPVDIAIDAYFPVEHIDMMLKMIRGKPPKELV